MSRKKKLTAQAGVAIPVEIPKQVPRLFPTGNFKLVALLIFLFASGIYYNTIHHEYALDDGIVITENEFTKKGFSGIGDIFTEETFSAVAGVKNELSGGRYRPLSIASFAIEYGMFGPRPSVSHLVNLLLYGFLCVLLLYFLKEYIFRNNLPTAIIATLIFAAHPLHTDVVSNIKGRDELLCLLLLISCLIFYGRHAEKKRWLLFFASLLAYFLSLLAKENGITFIAVIPLFLYFFMNRKLKEALFAVIPFIFVFIFYFYIRLSVTGFSSTTTQEVMNAPFVLAQGDQALATKIMILGKDLMMLVYPHPLSFDYSYNQIPYVHLTDWKCLLSIAVNGILVFTAIKLFKRRHIISFSILFYYITLSIVTNFVFEVGSPFNERFLFQPSIGFAIAIAYLLNRLATMKADNMVYKTVAVTIAAAIIIAGGIKTLLRNPDWKNNESLFLADAVHAPRSAKTNNFAGVVYITKADKEKDSALKYKYFERAIPNIKKALEIYPNFADAYINLGDAYVQQGKLELSKQALLKAKAIYPDNKVLNINLQYLAQQYIAEGTKLFAEKNIAGAIQAANAALECMPDNINAWYNLGGYYLSLNNIQKAREVWTKTLSLDPSNQTIKYWLNRISVPPTQH